MFAEDLNVFFDTAGFASTHTINGVSGVVCIVGDEVTGPSEIDGTWIVTVEVMVKKADIVAPARKQAFFLDSVRYTVDSVKDDGGVLTIAISRPMS